MMEHYRSVGILGYGKLGQYLVNRIQTDGDRFGLKLAFVWNRSKLPNTGNLPVLDSFSQLPRFKVDLIVEVCHPEIIRQHGATLLRHAHLLVGSSTALADDSCAEKLKAFSLETGNRLLLARGALWGANDIQRMARQGLLGGLKVTMSFHPRSLRLLEGTELKAINDQLLSSESGESTLLYEGPVRQICRLAPNNVNTMATAALIGLGLDHTQGCLISDANLLDHHRITVEASGIQRPGATRVFKCTATRISPTSTETSVSSTQTFDAFWESLLESLGLEQNAVYVC